MSSGTLRDSEECQESVRKARCSSAAELLLHELLKALLVYLIDDCHRLFLHKRAVDDRPNVAIPRSHTQLCKQITPTPGVAWPFAACGGRVMQPVFLRCAKTDFDEISQTLGWGKLAVE